MARTSATSTAFLAYLMETERSWVFLVNRWSAMGLSVSVALCWVGNIGPRGEMVLHRLGACNLDRRDGGARQNSEISILGWEQGTQLAATSEK